MPNPLQIKSEIVSLVSAIPDDGDVREYQRAAKRLEKMGAAAVIACFKEMGSPDRRYATKMLTMLGCCEGELVTDCAYQVIESPDSEEKEKFAALTVLSGVLGEDLDFERVEGKFSDLSVFQEHLGELLTHAFSMGVGEDIYETLGELIEMSAEQRESVILNFCQVRTPDVVPILDAVVFLCYSEMLIEVIDALSCFDTVAAWAVLDGMDGSFSDLKIATKVRAARMALEERNPSLVAFDPFDWLTWEVVGAYLLEEREGTRVGIILARKAPDKTITAVCVWGELWTFGLMGIRPYWKMTQEQYETFLAELPSEEFRVTPIGGEEAMSYCMDALDYNQSILEVPVLPSMHVWGCHFFALPKYYEAEDFREHIRDRGLKKNKKYPSPDNSAWEETVKERKAPGLNSLFGCFCNCCGKSTEVGEDGELFPEGWLLYPQFQTALCSECASYSMYCSVCQETLAPKRMKIYWFIERDSRERNPLCRKCWAEVHEVEIDASD